MSSFFYYFVLSFCYFVFLQAAVGNYYSEDLAETLQMYHRSGRSFDELDNTIADFCEASSFGVGKIRLNTKLNMHQKISKIAEGGRSGIIETCLRHCLKRMPSSLSAIRDSYMA